MLSLSKRTGFSQHRIYGMRKRAALAAQLDGAIADSKLRMAVALPLL